MAGSGGDVEEGAAVLVAKGEVGRGEGGERGGVAGLRRAEELLLRRPPLPAAGSIDVHRRGHQEVLRAGSREGGAGGKANQRRQEEQGSSSKRPFFQERRRPWASPFLAVNGPLCGIWILRTTPKICQILLDKSYDLSTSKIIC